MAHYKGAASEAGRAMQLMKKREQQIQDIEIRKKRIEDDLRVNDIENKFATHYDAVEQQLKALTTPTVKRLKLLIELNHVSELDNRTGDTRRDEGQAGEHRQGAREKARPEAAREGARATEAAPGEAGRKEQAKATGNVGTR